MKRFEKEARQKTGTEIFLAVLSIGFAIVGVYKAGGVIDFETGIVGDTAIYYVLMAIVGFVFGVFLLASIVKDTVNDVKSVSAKLTKIEVIEEDPQNNLLEGYKFEFQDDAGNIYEWFDSERNKAEEGATYLLVTRKNNIVGVLEKDGGYILFGEENVDEWRYPEEEYGRRIDH